MSQSDITKTDFLESCVSKKRNARQVTEALGLYMEGNDPRKEPVFIKSEANKLYRRIREYADAFKARYKNNRKTLLDDLVKDGCFDYEVQLLSNDYGQTLWGGIDSQLQELSWDEESDRQRYVLSLQL